MNAILLSSVLLFLLWAVPVSAQILHPYEYETALVSAPVLLTGKGSVEVLMVLPEEGLMLTPHLKSCEVFGYPPVVLDEDITFYVHTRHPDRNHLRVVIGDRHRGRSQWFCVRLPYVPRVEP